MIREQSPCYALPIILFFLLLVFYERLILRFTLTEVRETFVYTWWTLTVIRVVSIWVFLVLLKLQGRPKSDEIWHIF